MILDPNQAEQRLSNPNNLANRLAEFRRQKKLALDDDGVLSVNPGRNLPRLPVEVRSEIADRVLSGESTVSELATEYGVSPPTVSRIKKQAEAIEREDRKALQQQQEMTREQFLEESIKDAAKQKMLLAMGLITEEKLGKLKATDLASVSASMAKVLGTVAPKTQDAAINLVIYSPEVRTEASYQVVEIRKDN